MDKSVRLRDNREYNVVYKRGKTYYNRNFSLVVYNSKKGTRIGFSVTKKYGNAVERNRIKRKLREIVRLNFSEFDKGLDMVIIPKKNTEDLTYKQLESALLHVCRKASNKNVKSDDIFNQILSKSYIAVFGTGKVQILSDLFSICIGGFQEKAVFQGVRAYYLANFTM